MNWFTWMVMALGVLLVAWLLYEMVRPRRGGVSARSERREGDIGDAMYRGGHSGRPWDGTIGGP